MAGARRSTLLAGSIAGLAAFAGLSLWGWGEWWTFWQHPARLAVFAVMLAGSVAAGFAPISLLGGVRGDERADAVLFLAMLPCTVLLAWLPPYADRRGLLVLDGDAVRYGGLALFVVGIILRVAPMFVLRHRFSPLVAIQPGHTLVTAGVYRHIRHPSYLGGLVGLIGWVLVFRSLLGMVLIPVIGGLLVMRMRAEERLLAREFGEEYAAYCRRTWRLLPYVY